MPTLSHDSERSHLQNRIDIQALRAAAVLLVVVFHFFPTRLTGGYVGVDAFLATSGYLITGHLVRELEKNGAVDLPGFWARRARRLLPASFLVLAVVAIGAYCLAPPSTWLATSRDITWATLYSANFLFARNATDYFAQDAAPSPVQHYWSLCVEEQFYLFWPLVFGLVGLLTRKKALVSRQVMGVVSFLLLASSFWFCVRITNHSPATSYFLPWTRAWEFVAGGLIAIYNIQWPSRIRPEVPRWLGLASLVAIAALQTDSAAFPGWIATLPVAATLLILVPSRRSMSPLDFGILRILEPLGNISYSVYLWHWPLLVLFRQHTGRDAVGVELLVLLGATVLFAIFSKRYVEDPIRFSPWFAEGRVRRTLLATALGTCAILLFPFGLSLRFRNLHAAATAEIHSAREYTANPCFGAGSPASGPPCAGLSGNSLLVPSPLAPDDRPDRKCISGRESTDLQVCEFGDEQAPTRFALVGDSHAAHFVPGMAEAARRSNARFLVMLKGGCPLTQLRRSGKDTASRSCETWKAKVRAKLAERKDLKTLVSASRIVGARKASGYVEEWKRLPRHIRDVVVLRDIPEATPSVIECLNRLPSRDAQLERGACATPRSLGLRSDPAVKAAKHLHKRARYVDLSSIFCDTDWCYPVIGHSLVYFDDNHMTETFSRTLWPHFVQIFDKPKRTRAPPP
jgi:peptidoglycan/LPS O-acetylase OafA/YrhL